MPRHRLDEGQVIVGEHCRLSVVLVINKDGLGRCRRGFASDGLDALGAGSETTVSVWDGDDNEAKTNAPAGPRAIQTMCLERNDPS